ncbi:MAG: DUF368 domain-containing protein [bacterium]|nr:DUF368 domain-containing protein [bacterium]MCY3652781.1 DUF368 domain-containing protein [bacterium]MDE0643295.1 DUF368 domain-containing protein [bacterium]
MSSPFRRPIPLLLLLLRGFGMGTADLIPGVSGGTVALVTGIYPTLVGVIGDATRVVTMVVKADLKGAGRSLRRIDWWFLIPLLAGAGVAIVALARVIEYLLREQPVRTAAVFCGLIAGSLWVAWKIIRSPRFGHFLVALIVGGTAFYLFGLRSAEALDPAWFVYLIAGALAICAFILPGVSGAFILLVIGMYQPVLAALNDPRPAYLATFAMGAAVGLGLFSRLLQWLLDRYHDLVVAVMIGLMLGSFRILWPWPNGLGDESGTGATTLGAPGPDVLVPVILAILAALVVLGISVRVRRV